MAECCLPRVRRIIEVVHIISGVTALGDVCGLALMHLEALNSGSLFAREGSEPPVAWRSNLERKFHG